MGDEGDNRQGLNLRLSGKHALKVCTLNGTGASSRPNVGSVVVAAVENRPNALLYSSQVWLAIPLLAVPSVVVI